MSWSSKPFPVSGGEVSDGSKIPPSTIPLWLATIVHARLVTMMGRGMPSLDEIEKSGGFRPLGLLDVLAGGNGDGTAFLALQSRRITILDRSILPHLAILKKN